MEKKELALSGFSPNDRQTHPPEDTVIFEQHNSVNAAPNKHVVEGDENMERGNWSSKADYFLSVIGCAVGLSNVWRFPYLAYKNGGGVFLIPYTIMLAFIAMPMFYLESSFGQFASLGPVAVWKAVPMLQGVGITMVLFSTIIDITYNCIIGYSLYYLFASFQSPLPWSDCFSWWGADETCSRTPKDPLCNLTLDDGYFEIINTTWLWANDENCPNGSEISVPHQSPSEQYWEKMVLNRSSSIEETGDIVWYLALCLLLAWLIVGAALSKGIKSSGKVVYFTATFPYVVLTILLIRGVTLEGAYKGIEFYVGKQLELSKLADAEVWKDAATQIFYSLAVGWGSLITLSSYNKFHNNCYTDTIVVCVVNCTTSVFAGFVIFSILGHMAHRQDKLVSEVIQSGFGLAFIAYPEALAQLPWAPLWAALFFFMLITLGLSSQFVAVEAIITSLLDQFPTFLRSKRFFVTAGVCLALYLLSVPCVTQVILVWSVVTFAPPTYGPVEYPVWAIALGWSMTIFCIMWIPVVAVVRVVQAEGSTLWQKICAACTSAPDWGPYLEEHRGERYRNKLDSKEAPNCLQLLATPEI
ncbi:sodium- and chloride-dependent neutral and basic amino acid transporter B(0+)-like isoform X2 [Stegostoma tigrinum]|uniref:sodium- and chloride-dependent neutral and basic amino acid transporter B(0+)-like isoform X2 n=1 Tax=Stegostoma tigrinum TaxID=3053191 RepID=UPI0028700B0F|nr:sodium- and chloride-dependent neutral and basic amino acid transporter B(0+)-like isoform X2 [Stegostoma tigrinum]